MVILSSFLELLCFQEVELCSGETRRRLFRVAAMVLFAGVAKSAPNAGAKYEQSNTHDDETKGSDSADDAVYEPGGTVKPPKLVHYVEPAFSSSSKEAFVEGTVRISTVVTTTGQPSESKVVKGLNADEDRTALEAVDQWRFEPGTKDGKPVKVHVNVEVDFHLM